MANQSTIISAFSVLTLFCIGSTVAQAGNDPYKSADSTQTIDSVPLPDTLAVEAAGPPDTVTYSDTLTDAQRQLLEFESRYRKLQEEKQREVREPFSFLDSMISYFLSPRMNQRQSVEQSFFLDPGDYFKFDPGYFILDHQVTPMRKTVQPYALSGDRLAVLHNGVALRPFEHIPEPDGLLDLNDVPSALDHDRYLLPGSVGRLFGGGHSAATLLTRAKRSDSFEPESAFLVDKGSFGYSYARGRYSRRFQGGRNIDMSIGYRKADGANPSFLEDAYHYFGDVYFPVRPTTALQVTGHLYDREGRLAIRPDRGGGLQARDRFDRNLTVAFVRHNEEHSSRYEIGYRHIRQGSYLTQRYKANFDQTGHGGYLSREWVANRFLFRVLAEADYLEYEYGSTDQLWLRRSGGLTVSAARLGEEYHFAFQASQHFVKNFKAISSVTGILQHDSERLFMLLSIGYSERPPSLHELYLPYQAASIYGRSLTDYADQGNSDLNKEKQLVGSLNVEMGRPDNKIGVQLTAGKIIDGIDWQEKSEGVQTRFSPVNHDIDFATITGTNSVRIADFLRFHGGASYHYLAYEGIDKKPYTPEYQMHSGLELHWFWSQKLIDLNAYGEIAYIGPYDGYAKTGMGQEPVANAKLSFRMGKFRFHYIFRNVLSRIYDAREDFAYLGRYNSWGFTWTFLN